MDGALRAMAEYLLETASDQFEETAGENDPDGHHAYLRFLQWVSSEVESWKEITMACIEDRPDVTGNPWSDCICNDAATNSGTWSRVRRTGDRPTRRCLYPTRSSFPSYV